MFAGVTLEKGVAIIFLFVVILAVLVTARIVFRRKRPKLNQKYFESKWKEIQEMLIDMNGAKMAVIEADKLLDEALKQLHIGGSTMGERLVAAQRKLTNNDAVWTAHKLRNRLVHETEIRLKKSQIKDALIGFRRALKDLGAL